MTTVAVMQPAYLPWQGFMDMIDQADLFILLDTVEVSKQSWQTRNRIVNANGEVQWLSVPNNASPGVPLNEVQIVESKLWRHKHGKTLEAIAKHPIPEVLDAYAGGWTSLTRLTAYLTRAIARVLGITTPIFLASEYELPPRANPIDRLGDLLDATSATEFLTAAGSRAYLASEYELSVPTRFHEYQPQPYDQGTPDFVPYMSVVDCLARHGPEYTLETVRAGRMSSAPF